jgi:hypothetical protein
VLSEALVSQSSMRFRNNQGSKLPDAKTLNASVFFILRLKIDMWTTKNVRAYFSMCTKIVPIMWWCIDKNSSPGLTVLKFSSTIFVQCTCTRKIANQNCIQYIKISDWAILDYEYKTLTGKFEDCRLSSNKNVDIKFSVHDAFQE